MMTNAMTYERLCDETSRALSREESQLGGHLAELRCEMRQAADKNGLDVGEVASRLRNDIGNVCGGVLATGGNGRVIASVVIDSAIDWLDPSGASVRYLSRLDIEANPATRLMSVLLLTEYTRALSMHLAGMVFHPAA